MSSQGFAVDGIIETCFTSKQENFPFIKVQLKQPMYVNQVVLVLRKSCCDEKLKLRVTIEDKNKKATACSSVSSSSIDNRLNFNCPIVFTSLDVILTRMEKNSTLQVCEMQVYDLDDYHGALQEIWFHKIHKLSITGLKSLISKSKPAVSSVMRNFEASMNIADFYGQRLSSFLKISTSGKYIFYMACKDACELMYKVVPDFIFREETMQVLLKPKRTTARPNNWNRDSSQMSSPVFLHRCAFYRLEAYTVTERGYEHLSVGIRMAKDGKLLRPISGSLLQRTLTGNRTFSLSFKDNSQRVTVHVNSVVISGSYQYCCNGIYCPNCPLYFYLNSTKALIGNFTKMSCKPTYFEFVLRDYYQLGKDSLEIAFDFPDEDLKLSKTVGSIEIKAVIINECSFANGVCSWLNTDNVTCWEMSTDINDEVFPFVKVDKKCRSTLKSNNLPWKPYQMNTSLCIQFSYRMSSEGSLSVVRYSNAGEERLWNLTGYQGSAWHIGRVELSGISIQKIGFEGHGTKSGSTSVGLTNITVATHRCERHPIYAKPELAFCKRNEFQCDNKQCIDRKLKCDGDKHCIDESDERGCDCPSVKFLCPSGECIDVASVCNDKPDCADGTDETNCGHRCKEKFQCVDGSCTDWKNTCRIGSYCTENSHNPNICGHSNCTLKNLGCNTREYSPTKQFTMCTTISVPCSFDDGFCGFTHDVRSQRKWFIGQSATPTQNTGPSIDHTTLTHKGSYIFIEASEKKLGDKKARLTSCWFNANITQCLQFWYHMYGIRIGSLRILKKTNSSEDTIWDQSENKGDLWRFGQTTLEGNDGQNYQFVIEGVTRQGNEMEKGDIAVDDVTLHDGVCKTVSSRGPPPNCRKDQLLCKRGLYEGLYEYESTTLNQDDYTWKCFELFFNSTSSKKRFIIDILSEQNRSFIIFSTPGTNFAEVPLPNGTHTEVRVHRPTEFYPFSGNFSSQTCIQTIRTRISGDGALAVYPLNTLMQGEDVLNRNPGGEFANIFPDEGPDGTPGGAYRFIGTPESYVEFENDEERLEAKNSLSLLAWIKHTGNQGPIFNYDTDGWGVHFWMRGKNKLFARFNKRGNVEVSSISSNGVKAGVWQYVGATYNGQTGMAKLFISDRFVVEKYIGKGFQLATNHNVRMGARLGDKRYFNGSISCMQVYSKALSHNQIMSFKKRCFRTSSLCLWFDTSCYWRSNSSQSSWVKKMQSGDYLSDQLKMKWDTQDVDEDFELHLSPSSKEVVEIQKSSKETNSFTICFWKKGGGIYVRSYLWLNISQEIFVNLQSPKSFGFVHNSTAWNFYCFLMAGKDEKVAVSFYLNGERKSLLLIKPEEINNETLTVGYLNSSVNDKAVLSSFNIWSGELSPSEVKRLSYGCDSERGDVIHWKDFNYVDHDHEVVETRTCKNVRKERLVLKGTGNFITVKVDQHAPSNAIGFCLKFRYMIYGPGARFFQTSILKEHEDVSSVVWKDDDNTQFRWKYADIPFLSPGYFQVKFEGSGKSSESYIAISQVFVENRFCSSGYSLLTPVCERNIITAPGIIEQLYYPHSSMYDMNCWWVIDAPDHHVIRFTFLEFLIPYTKGCNYVSLEIYDGDRESGDSLGRFCGYIYPQFVQSSSNTMTLHFHAPTNSAPIRGFKGHYEFLEGYHAHKDPSMIIKDCPDSCTCTGLSTIGNISYANKVVVEARSWLNDIPAKMPQRTAALMFQDKKITRIKGKAFSRLASLVYLDLSWNHIYDIAKDAFYNGSSLENLRLNNNFIKSLPRSAFRALGRLKMLDLGENLLTGLSENTFTGLIDLGVLSLRSNRIRTLPGDVFEQTINLTHLYLQENKLLSLPNGMFRFLSELRYLNLSHNRINSLNRHTFQGLKTLKNLDLRGNKLSKVTQDAFAELTELEDLKLDAFIYCCYAKKSIPGIKCVSTHSNEFSSCDDLMKNQVLRVFIWILGIFAVFGNMLVIIRRVRSKSGEKDTQSFFLFNLAVADFLMGVYLLIIAVVDIQWQGDYFKHDLAWRSGSGCATAGILSMVSSLVSVVMLTIVTYDRLICIVSPFSTRKITRKHAVIISGCLWLFGLLSAVLPVMNLDYFKSSSDDETGFGFYGRSSVCLPVQLSPDRLAGWEYAAGLFLGMPFIAFMFMLIAYIVIFYRVSLSSNKIRSTAVNRESALAKKLIFIILTDFLCWMPVIIIGTLALTRIFYDPTKQVYVWIAIFVLPINSSINPFLYTFSNLRRSTSTDSKIKAFRLSLFGTINSNGMKDCTVTETFYAVDDSPRQGSRKKKQKPLTEESVYLFNILEELKIQKYHSGVGYLLAEVENPGTRERCLLKYFDEDMEDAWEKELWILSLLKQAKNTEVNGVSLARYKWHCTAKQHSITGIVPQELQEIKNSALICFDYVPNKCLHDYLENKEPLTFRIVCSLCIDIISTIEYLQTCGISNNNINSRAIVVRRTGSQDSPVKAVIVDFSRAMKLQKYEDGSYAKADILQFRFLFRVLLRNCPEDCSHYQQIDDILSLCKYERKVDTAESIKYCLTSALMEIDETFNTKL